MTEASGL